MKFWKSCLFNFALTSAFEINVLHRPRIHKSFGEGSYIFNQPLYQHGIEGKDNNQITFIINKSHISDQKESRGYGSYEPFSRFLKL